MGMSQSQGEAGAGLPSRQGRGWVGPVWKGHPRPCTGLRKLCWLPWPRSKQHLSLGAVRLAPEAP